MANISFSKQNMTTDNGYFYMFDETYDVLVQKVDDGTTSFSYPLDTVLSNPIISLEYDGVNFWTLEDLTSELSTASMRIRRWYIDNYVCKLQNTFNFTESGSHKYNSNAFSIEHYHTTVTGTYSAGATNIGIGTGYGTKLSSGMTVTLGPNVDGYSETIDVFDAGEGYVILSDPTTYDFDVDDKVQFYNNIWMFNDFDGTDSSTGALYKFNAYLGTYITKYSGGAYKDVKAATFYNVNSFSTVYGNVDALCFVKSYNILFVNTDTVGSSLNYYGSMTMEVTGGVPTVYDLAMDGQNVYRLAGADYALSTLNSLVASIAISANPAIITANGVSSTNITAYVKDQFLQPVIGRLVTFTDSDGVGYIDPLRTTVNTDSDGKAVTSYTSGTTAGTVTINATVAQS